MWKIKVHTESAKVGAPLFHPKLLGRLIPEAVLQNRIHGFSFMLFVLIFIYNTLHATQVSSSQFNIQSRVHFDGEDESQWEFCYALHVATSILLTTSKLNTLHGLHNIVSSVK